MRFKNASQRKAVMAKLTRGDYVMTPHNRQVGQYQGMTKKGYKVVPLNKRTPIIYSKDRPIDVSDKSYNQLKRLKAKISKFSDSDRDGVINFKDCRPLNPDEQGFIHDFIVGAGNVGSAIKSKISKFKEGFTEVRKDVSKGIEDARHDAHERNMQSLHEQEERVESQNETKMRELNDKLDALKAKESIADKGLSIKRERAKQLEGMASMLEDERRKREIIDKRIAEATSRLEKGTIKGFIKGKARESRTGLIKKLGLETKAKRKRKLKKAGAIIADVGL